MAANRLIKFLMENEWGGQNGIDLYNKNYIVDIHPTITTKTITSNNYFIMEKNDNYIIVPSNTKDGCVKCEFSGVLDISYPTSSTRRGRVQDGGTIAPTLTCGCETTHARIETQYRIRRLTERECFRLMGVTDEDSNKIRAVVSKSQCYKLAGNSIVVDVLYYIFRQLYVENNNKQQQLALW